MLGVALAIVAETIIGSLTVFYTLMIVILFVPLIGGLYARRLGTTEALAAIAAGVSALVALQLWNDGAGIGYRSRRRSSGSARPPSPAAWL